MLMHKMQRHSFTVTVIGLMSDKLLSFCELLMAKRNTVRLLEVGK
jgi:hypothetical protein